MSTCLLIISLLTLLTLLSFDRENPMIVLSMLRVIFR